MTHGLWQVVGTRAFRGHEPGTDPFEASLPSNQAARAIRRGDIALLEEFVPNLPDEHQLPKGWND